MGQLQKGSEQGPAGPTKRYCPKGCRGRGTGDSAALPAPWSATYSHLVALGDVAIQGQDREGLGGDRTLPHRPWKTWPRLKSPLLFRIQGTLRTRLQAGPSKRAKPSDSVYF